MKSKLTSVQTEQPTQETSSLGCFKTTKAFEILFHKARQGLSIPELELLERASSSAMEETSNLSDTIQGIGLSIDEGHHNLDVQTFLFYLSSQLDAIAGMINIGEEASFELEARKNMTENKHTAVC